MPRFSDSPSGTSSTAAISDPAPTGGRGGDGGVLGEEGAEGECVPRYGSDVAGADDLCVGRRKCSVRFVENGRFQVLLACGTESGVHRAGTVNEKLDVVTKDTLVLGGPQEAVPSCAWGGTRTHSGHRTGRPPARCRRSAAAETDLTPRPIYYNWFSTMNLISVGRLTIASARRMQRTEGVPQRVGNHRCGY